MRKVYLLTGLCLMLAVMAAGIARAAEEVTLKGTVMCAKCSLKKADAKEYRSAKLLFEGDQLYAVADENGGRATVRLDTGKTPSAIDLTDV